MTIRDFKLEFNNLIKTVVYPIFKEHGFRKKANYFYRTTNDLIQIFNIQKSPWNSVDDLSFTFNIGFFHNEIYKETENKPAPKDPKEYICFLSIRSGFITHKQDHWYSLNKNISLDRLSIDIKTDLLKSAIYLFNRHNTLTSLRSLFEEYPDLIHTIATVPYFLYLIKTDSSKEAIEYLVEKYKNALIPETSIAIINFPDGRTKEYKSDPKICQEYIDSLKQIASRYNILF